MILFYNRMRPLPPPCKYSLYLVPDFHEASLSEYILLSMYHSSSRMRPLMRIDEKDFERYFAAQRVSEETIPLQNGYLHETHSV